MTRENILRQIATLQTQLDEMDKTQELTYGNISLTHICFNQEKISANCRKPLYLHYRE